MLNIIRGYLIHKAMKVMVIYMLVLMLELSAVADGRRGDSDSRDSSRQPGQRPQSCQTQDQFSDNYLQSSNVKLG